MSLESVENWSDEKEAAAGMEPPALPVIPPVVWDVVIPESPPSSGQPPPSRPAIPPKVAPPGSWTTMTVPSDMNSPPPPPPSLANRPKKY